MAHLNSQKEIKEIFHDIENRFCVDQWTVNQVHVWPYVRIKLYYYLLNKNNNNQKINIKNNTSEERITTSKFLRLFKAFVSHYKFYFGLSKKEILFVGSHFHRILNEDGLYFNKFFDPLIEKFNLQSRVYVFEFQKFYDKYFNQNSVIPLVKHLNNFKLINKIKGRLKNKNINSVEVKDYSLFLSYLNTNIDGFYLPNINEKELVKWSNKILSLNSFYTAILSKIQPKKIVFLSYYGFDDNYALIYYAKKLKIKTVDFQHGPQTNVHMAYSDWNNQPKDGFNIMPDEYWNWDQISKNNIDKWAKNTTVESKLVGQPYIDYCLKLFKDIKKEYSILFSLQTSPLELLTPKVINLIKDSNKHWVLRLHPRNDVSLENINTFIASKGLNTNISIQESNTKPLPIALSESFIHITNYSGCVI